jgi:hypothetical protein
MRPRGCLCLVVDLLVMLWEALFRPLRKLCAAQEGGDTPMLTGKRRMFWARLDDPATGDIAPSEAYAIEISGNTALTIVPDESGQLWAYAGTVPGTAVVVLRSMNDLLWETSDPLEIVVEEPPPQPARKLHAVIADADEDVPA